MANLYNTKIAALFLRSAQTMQGVHSDLPAILQWINALNESTHHRVCKISFPELKCWRFSESTGALLHESGKFFSIEGYRIQSTWDPRRQWDQPLINQAEVGYLGFLVQEFEGVLHFLVQAKIEPGNSNVVQLSPTLQATRSNYTQVHGGNKPHYLQYFQHAKPHQILLDQLQSEQGSRFLAKRNRNIIVKVEETIPVLANFCWVTLGQLKALMAYDNVLNMDSRTVISGIHYGSFSDHNAIPEVPPFVRSTLDSTNSIFSYEQIFSLITHHKSIYDSHRHRIPLSHMQGWQIDEATIQQNEGTYFKVIAVDVSIEGREVQHWTQPMVEPAASGLCALICKSLNGVLHFAFQIKSEAGNHDQFELAPTVQMLEGLDQSGRPIDYNPFVHYVQAQPPECFYFDAIQAEEGGRFYRDNNRNCIILADENFPEELPNGFLWLTLHQVCDLMRFNNLFNIQARSLIAAIRLDS